MSRESLKYGQKITLYCDARNGYIVGTNSALAPIGVKCDSPGEPIAFERAVFTVFPGDGDIRDTLVHRHFGEDVKFGQVIRLVHNTQRKTIAFNSKLHALVDKANQRVTLEMRVQSGDQLKWDKWRVMPRYKVRGEGERVCNGDHVVLQVSTGEQSYLHVSKKQDEALDGAFEVNAGAVSEGFAVHIYDSELPRLVGREERELRGGDCVMMYHKEERSYLMVDDIIKRCVLDPIDELAVAAGQKVPDTQDSHTMFVVEFNDRTRGGIITSGRKQLFRLKTLSSGDYLCVHSDSAKSSNSANESPSQRSKRSTLVAVAPATSTDETFHLGLTRDMADLGTLFAFHQAADDQGSFLKSRSRVYLECPLVGGGLWIVGGGRLQRKTITEALGLPSREHGAHSRHGGAKAIVCQQQHSPKDGLELQRLRSADYRQLSIVLALLPPLQQFNAALVNETPDYGRVAQVQENLVHLHHMCYVDMPDDEVTGETVFHTSGAVDPKGQKRLLDQGVAQLCVDIVRNILNSPFIDVKLLHSMETVGQAAADQLASSDNTTAQQQFAVSTAPSGATSELLQVKYADVLDVINLCFSLVQVIVRNAPHNALEVAPDIEFIVSCVDLLPSALSCLIECVRDNLALVDTPNDLKILSHFCGMLQQRGHDRAILEILTLLVECNGVGLPVAQMHVCDKLLRRAAGPGGLFLPFTSSAGQVSVGVPSFYLVPRGSSGRSPTQPAGGSSSSSVTEASSVTYVPLTGILDAATPSNRMQHFLEYATRQTLFFAALCRSRNASAAAMVHQLVPLDILLPTVLNDDVPDGLRAACIRLFTTSAVDISGAVNLVDEIRSLRHVTDNEAGDGAGSAVRSAYNLHADVPSLLVSAKRFVTEFLARAGDVMSVKDALAQHMLRDAVIELCGALVTRGAYAPEEYAGLVMTLTRVLDGRNDDCGDNRFLITEEMRPIVATKLAIVKILDIIFDFVVTRRVGDVVHYFVRGLKLGHFSQLLDFNPFSDVNERSAERMVDLKSGGGKKRAADDDDDDDENGRSKRLADFSFLVYAVMDASQYGDAALSTASIKLFCKMTNMPGQLLSAVRRVQLLTSQASELYYDNVKRHASVLDRCTRGTLNDERIEDAAAAIGDIEELLQSRAGGTLTEKIAVVRHLDVPLMIMTLLSGVQAPPREDLRPFLLRAVGVLRVLSQDELISETLVKNVHMVLHLLQHDVDVLLLLRALYVGQEAVQSISFETLAQIVACIGHPPTAVSATLLLQDILAKKDVRGKYINRNQNMVWKALITDSTAEECVKFRLRWTGKRGSKKRDRLLGSPEYYNTTGELRLHLELVRLLYLCAKLNDSVKPEEVRYEVFGPTAVDDMMEVVANKQLPAFYRFSYINLLQVLVVDDPSCVSSFFGHRLFGAFLEMCKADIVRLHTLCSADGTGTVVAADSAAADAVQQFSPNESQPAKVESSAFDDHFVQPPPPLSMPPRNEMDQAIEDRRHGQRFYVDHVCLAVLPCLRHASQRFSKSASRISLSFQVGMSQLINEAIDATCELTRFVFVQRDFTHFAGFGDSAKCRKKVHDFLETVARGEHRGTELWAEDVGNLALAVPVAPPRESDDAKKKAEGDDSDGDDDDDSGDNGAASGHIERPLTKRWLDFIDANLVRAPQLQHENIFATGAGIILRSGVDGSAFAKCLVQNLEHLTEVMHKINVLHLLRQLVSLSEGHEMDDSVLLHYNAVGDDGTFLSFSRDTSERQDIIAEWSSIGGSSTSEADCSLLPKVVNMLSGSDPEQLHAAVTCAITLLDGGNANMQNTFMQWVRLHTEEEIFVVLRNRISMCRDALRMYRYARQRGAPLKNLLDDVPLCRLLLRFVQLLCEGHNNDVQNYFRLQPDNQVSVNVLESMVELLECCSTVLDRDTIALTTQLLASISETIQGPCRQNQEMFVSINLAEFVVALIGMDNTQCADCDAADFAQLQNNAITTLLSLIEGRMDVTYISSLLQSLSLDKLGHAMDRSTRAYDAAHGSGNFFSAGLAAGKTMLLGDDDVNELQDQLSIGVSIFIFFKFALDLQNLAVHTAAASGGSGSGGHSHHHAGEFVDKKGRTLKVALGQTASYKRINELVGMIEIVRDGTLERAYFRIPRISKNLREESKDHLIKQVNRDSDNQRLQDFFERSLKLLAEMEYYQDLRKTPGLAFVHENTHYFEMISLLAAFAVNIMLLFTLRAPEDKYKRAQTDGEELGLTILSFVLLVVQSLLFINFFFGPTRVFLNDRWMRWQDEQNEELMQESRKNLSIERADIDRSMVEKLSFPYYMMYSSFLLLRFGKFWQHLLYIIAAYLGYFHTPIWFSLLLLQITQKSSQLYNVVLAVTKNGSSLILTGILLLIVIYIFSIVAFYNFAEYFDVTSGFGNGLNCDTLAQCVVVLAGTGLRFGGGVGEVMAPPIFLPGDARGYLRLLFDFLFFVILIIIFLNIVFGIIVDTFAELREKREFVEEDQAQKCFICGIESNAFDRVAPGGFEHHIKFEHNMWHYVAFFQYIKAKPQDDLNGQEHYVAAMIESNEPVFYPIGKAMMLSSELTPEEEARETEARLTRAVTDSVAQLLAPIEARVAAMSDQIEELEQQLAAAGRGGRSPLLDDPLGATTGGGSNFAASQRWGGAGPRR